MFFGRKPSRTASPTRFDAADDALAGAAEPEPWSPPSLARHFNPEGRKRILALDGGGVRGALTIAILERLEALLRKRHGDHPDFRLCDYFDLIGGASTGAIIAAGLAAKRFSAEDIKTFYFELAPKVFASSAFRLGFTRPVFDGKRLLKILDGQLGDTRLGDPSIATGLAVIAKRVDTSSTWVMHNHPHGRYFDAPVDDAFVGNRHYPLRNIVRASTAAPHYFQPERIEIVKGRQYGLFVDGGVSPHNNPAFTLLMLAGLKRHPYRWRVSAEDLLIVSIGTGTLAARVHDSVISRRLHILNTKESLLSMITSAEDFVETLMQWVSESADPRIIDSEIGDLRGELIGGEPLFSYQRYQTRLSRDYIATEYGLRLSTKDVETVRNMTDPKALPIAYAIGEAIADTMVKDAHLPARFDLNAPATAPPGDAGAADSNQPAELAPAENI
jgi:hypothetical protein